MNAGWIALIVFGSLLLLFILLLLSHVRLRIYYNEGGSGFRISWFLIRKTMKIDDAARLFDGRKKAKDEKSEEKTADETKPEEKRGKTLPLSWQIERVAALLSRIVNRLPRTLTLRARRVAVTVSTSDAAKTALLYGAVSASLAGLLEIVDRNVAHVKTGGRDLVDVRADFVSGKTRAELDLTFSARVAGTLRILFTLLFSGVSGGTKKHKAAAKKKNVSDTLPQTND